MGPMCQCLLTIATCWIDRESLTSSVLSASYKNKLKVSSNTAAMKN